MPKSKPQRKSSSKGVAPAPVPDAVAISDALGRSATECCRQHDRVARIAERSELEPELKFAQQICELCDSTMQQLVDAYEKASAGALRNGEGWSPRATALWQASRDYLRRHNACDHLTSQLQRHSSAHLGALAMEYELEASAMLSLRHATEAYRKERPDAS
jgi:hypothetical protein